MNKTKRKRALAGVLSLAIAGMNLPAGLAGELRALAAGEPEASTALLAFSNRVQTMCAQDKPEDYFDTLTITAGQNIALEDGTPVSLGGTATFRDGVMMVPAGFFGSSADASVQSEQLVPLEETAEAKGYSVTMRGTSAELTNDFQTARLIIKAAGSIDTLGATQVAAGFNQLHIHQYATPEEAFAAYQRYQTMDGVEFVQPSVYMQLAADETAAAPAGPQPASVAGEHYTWGAEKMQVETYCNYLNESFDTLPEVVVAVVDTGVDYHHEWLGARLTDGGRDFTNSGSVQDVHGHGTHVSGTICDLTPENVKILPVRVLDDEGFGSTEQIYFGMCYAAEMGADVANLSLGGYNSSPLYDDIINSTYAEGTIFCLAAGNDSMDANLFSPANADNAITVSAVDSNDVIADFSNFGSVVDLAAPGVDIRSAANGGGLTTMSGTSMATPHVAGCVALLKCCDKTLNTAQALDILKAHAVDLGEPGYDTTYGYGRVSMDFADMMSARCSAPMFQLESGSYTGKQTIRVGHDADSKVYYTTDGSVPSAENGTLCTGAIVITESTVLRAVAVAEGYGDSPVVTAKYMLDGKDVPNAVEITDGVLTAYRGIQDELDLRDDSLGLTAIGADAFADNTDLLMLWLPDSVTSIGDSAFRGCTGLEQVTAPGVTTVGNDAFLGCAALFFFETAPLTAAGTNAFAETGLYNFDASALTEIPVGMFRDCTRLESVSFSSATVIGDDAFRNCTAIYVLSCDYSIITSIGSHAFDHCYAVSDIYELPALTFLGAGAFADTSVNQLILPEAITVLPADCFSNCGAMKSLTAPGVTEIEANALALNTYQNVDLQLDWTKVTKIGQNAMSGLVLDKPLRLDALTELGDRAFMSTQLLSIALPLLTEAPENALMTSNVDVVELEHATSVRMDSFPLTRKLVLGADCTEITPATAAGAAAMRAQIHQLGQAAEELLGDDFAAHTVLAGYADSYVQEFAAANGYTFFAIPYIDTLAKTLVTQQYNTVTLDSSACGFGLSFQWYQSPDGIADGTAIEGAVGTNYNAFPTEAGSTYYWCAMTDTAGKTTRSGMFTVQASALETIPLAENEIYELTGMDRISFSFTPAEDSMYGFPICGDVWIEGTLIRPSGEITSIYANTYSAMSAGETYIVQLSLTDTNGYSRFRICDVAKRAENDLSNGVMTVDPTTYPLTDSPVVPQMTVEYDGVSLKEGVDYEVLLRNNTEVGQATAYAYGIGKYDGCLTSTFDVSGVLTTGSYAAMQVRQNLNVSYSFTPETTGTYGIDIRTGVTDIPWTVDFYVDVYDAQETQLCSLMSSDYGAKGMMLCGSDLALTAGETYSIRCYGYGFTGEESIAVRMFDQTACHNMAEALMNYESSVGYTGTATLPALDITLEDGTVLTAGTDYQVIPVAGAALGTSTFAVQGINDYYGILNGSYETVIQSDFVPEVEISADTVFALDFSKNTTLCCTLKPETVGFYQLVPVSGDTATVEREVYLLEEREDGTYGLIPQSKMPSLDEPLELFDGQTYLFVITCAEPATVELKAAFTPSLVQAEVTVPDYDFTGSVIVPEISVQLNGVQLTEGVDYTVAFENNRVIGLQNFSLQGMGIYNGMYHGSFQIRLTEAAETLPLLTDDTDSLTLDAVGSTQLYRLVAEEATSFALWIPAQYYTQMLMYSSEGEEIATSYSSMDTLRTLLTGEIEAGKTYYISVTAGSAASVGTLPLAHCTDCVDFAKDVTIDYDAYLPFNGTRRMPELHVTCGDAVLEDGTDYRVTNYNGGFDYGVGSLTICGLGKYIGTTFLSFVVYNDTLDISNAQPLNCDEEYAITPTYEEPLLYAFTAQQTGVYSFYVSGAPLETVKAELTVYDAELQPLMTGDAGGYTMQEGETVYVCVTSHKVSTGYYSQVTLQASFVSSTLLDESGFYYTIDAEGNVTISGYNAYDVQELNIPAYIDGAPVTRLEGYAFFYMDQLTKVTLPKTLKSIGMSAFVGTGLTEITIPAGCMPEENCIGMNEDGTLVDGFIIYGYADSPAQAYAEVNGITFEILEKVDVRGDVNGDELVDAGDAVVLLQQYAQLMLRGEQPTAAQLLAMDVNGDTAIDTTDAILILKAYAQSMLTGTIDRDILLAVG